MVLISLKYIIVSYNDLNQGFYFFYQNKIFGF